MNGVGLQALILDYLKSNGLSLVLLFAAVVILVQRDAELSKKIDDCNLELLDTYKESQKSLLQVINANTDALEELNRNQQEVKTLVKIVADK